MREILVAVLVLGGLGVILALLLVIADAVFLNYGECTLTINKERKITLKGGDYLLSALAGRKIFIPSSCGGKGSCGLCKVNILSGAGQMLPTEKPHLSNKEIAEHVRLSCQVRIRQDMELEIPPEILSLKEFQAKVERIVDLNYDTKEVRLQLVEPPELGFLAGQYINLVTPPYGANPEPVYRAYSIASPPSEKSALELVIRLVPGGICTTWVFDLLREGDKISFNGPYGEFTLRPTDRDIIFIAGGSGIAPIRGMLLEMAEKRNPRKAVFYYGANELRDLYYVELMKELEKKVPNFRYVPALARPKGGEWSGEKGLVTEVVDRHTSDVSNVEAYLCGSPAMIDACIEVLKRKGLSEDRIFFDKFA